MFALGMTDVDWFNYLRDLQLTQNVNYWTPTPWGVSKLQGGDIWCFMLKSPIRKIGGYGYFRRYLRLPLDEAWETYGFCNGCANKFGLQQRIAKYVRKNVGSEIEPNNHIIGCIELADCVFWSDSQFLRPDTLGLEFGKQTMKFKYFEGEPPFVPVSGRPA